LKEAQAEEPPESLMLYLLKSLPKEWDNFVAPMMLIIDTLDLPKVKANLLLEATRRKQAESHSPSPIGGAAVQDHSNATSVEKGTVLRNAQSASIRLIQRQMRLTR